MEKELEKKMEKLRKEIDLIDEQIVKSLNERAKIVLAIRSLKERAGLSVYDPKREEEIFNHLFSVNHGPLYNDDVRDIYEEILRVMKEIEK